MSPFSFIGATRLVEDVYGINSASSLAISSVTNELFWTASFNNQIERVSLSGENRAVYKSNAPSAAGLALDEVNRYLEISNRY